MELNNRKFVIKIDAYKILLLFAFFYDTILNFATAVFVKLPVVGLVGKYIVPVCLIVVIIANLLNGRIRIYKQAAIIIVLILAALVISYLFYPENRPFFNEHNMGAVFTAAIPFLILGMNFEADDETINYLTTLSYIAIVLNYAYLLFFTSSREMVDDNMHWAYLILIPVMFAIRGVFGKHNKFLGRIIKIAISLVGAFYILSMGARGPILIMIVYFGILLVGSLLKKGSRFSIIPIVVLTIIVISIASGSYMQVLRSINNILVSRGYSTRAFDLFFSNQYVSYTSGRDEIFQVLWSKICINPVLGYGAFGEWQFVGYSAHNIFLQISIHYGIILGAALLISYIVVVLKEFFVSRGTCARDIILIYFIFTFVRGIFGGDYFSDYFFFLLGFALHQKMKRKAHYCENTI